MAQPEIKSFVIDTNVFIHKPDAVLSFRESEVVVPMWVLEELDKLKTYSDERGRNARAAIRFLDKRVRNGDPSVGVKIENGSLLRIISQTPANRPSDLRTDEADNKILLTALALQESRRRVFFVSKDINARVKAAALGIKAVDYEKQTVNIEHLYTGFRNADANEETIDALTACDSVPWKERLNPNEFVFISVPNSDRTVAARCEGAIAAQISPNEAVFGIRPLNIHQHAALNLLLDDEISLVTLVGKAGTGKTLLAIAAGLEKVVTEEEYDRVLVTRPVVPFGKDIGYLPGSKDEKLTHWMQPLFDNLDLLLSANEKQKVKSVDALLNNNLIEIEALTYIRGRSLPSQFIIIDEEQNLSPHEIKTIVSRAGEHTKVVLTGDPFQIDSNSNGLTYLVDTFKGQTVFGHIMLEKSERSRLAELAAELL